MVFEKIKKHIDAVLFDMDGTIITTEAVWKKASWDTLLAYGVSEETLKQQFPAFYLQVMGAGVTACAESLIKSFGLTGVKANSIVASVREIAKEGFQSNINYVHGFEAFHALLKSNGIKTAIATNCSPEPLAVIDKTLGLTDLFDGHVYSIADVNYLYKPDPAVFLYAAKQLGATPERSIIFEDSVHGIAAANAAKIKSVGIANEHNKGFLGKHVDVTIDSYEQAATAIIAAFSSNAGRI